jgi:hypothetical protein
MQLRLLVGADGASSNCSFVRTHVDGPFLLMHG